MRSAATDRMSTEAQGQPLPEGEVLRINEGEAAGRFFLGVFAVLAGIVYLLSKHGPYHPELGWLVPASSAILILGGIYAAASSRAGLIVEEDGITVQKAFGRTRWNWNRVLHFELTGAIYGPSLRIILLAEGGEARVRGFRARSRRQRELAEHWVAALNDRVDASITPGQDDSQLSTS